jgi:cyclophilin family peptidyl-prolyl cis-trans isomerase
MGADARVVQLQTSCGSLSVELYDNACADAFWQLACSGQLRRLVLRRLLAGFAILGEVEGVVARCITADEVTPLQGACNARPLYHVGAGLLSCRLVVGTPGCSSFVVTLSPQPQLDATHVVFGRVYSGIETVEKITGMQVDANFVLYTPVTVEKCSTAVLPRAAPPEGEVDAADANGYSVTSLSLKPLNSLVE